MSEQCVSLDELTKRDADSRPSAYDTEPADLPSAARESVSRTRKGIASRARATSTSDSSIAPKSVD